MYGLGRDLSDHYGLSTEVAQVREFTVDVEASDHARNGRSGWISLPGRVR